MIKGHRRSWKVMEGHGRSMNVNEGHGRWFPDTSDLDLGPGFGTGLGLDNF